MALSPGEFPVTLTEPLAGPIRIGHRAEYKWRKVWSNLTEYFNLMNRTSLLK